MWNKYPLWTTRLCRLACLGAWCVMACVAVACASNPTPHPAADAGFSINDPTDNEGTTNGGVPGPSPSVGEGDVRESADGMDGGSDTEGDVGPEDGGGSTEPMG